MRHAPTAPSETRPRACVAPRVRRFDRRAAILFLALTLALVARPVAADEAPGSAELFRTLVAGPQRWTLTSHDEPGYRIEISVTRVDGFGKARVARVSFATSEIDTATDVPSWTKPRLVRTRPDLPAQVAVDDRGVWWSATPRRASSWKRLLSTPPTFDAASTGTPRRLDSGRVSCFRMGATDSAAELCLAVGRGIVAVKRIHPAAPDALFVQDGWMQPK